MSVWMRAMGHHRQGVAVILFDHIRFQSDCFQKEHKLNM